MVSHCRYLSQLLAENSNAVNFANIPSIQNGPFIPGFTELADWKHADKTPIVRLSSKRESLLEDVFSMGEAFVKASASSVKPGMNGPFCIEGIYDENAKFTAFEFSARIVAGTNIYMDGSPYYGLLYGESISMGRRIAREIKDAKSQNRLDEIVT